MRRVAVIFDMDGVLVDTERLLLAGYEQAAQTLGVTARREIYFETIGKSVVDTAAVFAAHYGDEALGMALLERMRAIAAAHMRAHGVPVKPGAAELVAFLKERGCALALASSNSRAHIDAQLTGAGLLSYFEAIVSGDAVARAKPDPEIYLAAFEALGLPEAVGYAVEDSVAGVYAASAAGLRTMLVPDLLQPDETVRRLAAGVYESLPALQTHFASIL